METDEVISAEDAGIDAANMRGPRNTSPVKQGNRRPHRTGSSRSDDTNPPPYEDEETPLLARRGSDDLSEGIDGSGSADDFSGLPWYKRPSVFWMLVPFAIFTLSHGASLVPKLNLVLSLVCREYLADQAVANSTPSGFSFSAAENHPECARDAEVQSRVAGFQLYANLLGGGLAAIVAPRLGVLADSYGRKCIIILTMCGTVTGDLICSIAASKPDSFPSNVLLLGYAVDGLCGSFTTAMAITHAYATDCTPPKKRGEVFGYFHACLFTGIAIGPLFAGFLTKLTGTLATIFIVAAVVSAIVTVFIALAVPESLSKPRQMAAREKRRIQTAGTSGWSLREANPIPPLKILWPTGEGSSSRVRRNLILLALLDMIVFGVAIGSGQLTIYYSEYQFGWETLESSIFLSVVSFSRVFSLLVCLPVASRLIRGKALGDAQKNEGTDNFDLMALRLAIFMEFLGFIGFTLSRTGLLFTVSAAVASLGGIASPTLQSALTKHVPRDRTGQILGTTGLLHAVARVVAPTVLNALYKATVKSFAQALFVFLACLFFVSFLASWFILPHVYVADDDTADTETRPSQGDGEADPALET